MGIGAGYDFPIKPIAGIGREMSDDFDIEPGPKPAVEIIIFRSTPWME
jgi:hypothetical protein